MPKQSTTENALFEELSLLGLKAVQNYDVNKMPVAIAFPKRKIAIEIDDSLHEKPEIKAADEKRDAILESYGWRVLRLRSKDVEEDPTRAASDVEHFVGNEEEMIEDTEEETIGNEVLNDVKISETKMVNKIILKETPKSKMRQPKVSLAKLNVSRAKSKNKKSAKRIKPSLKGSVLKKTGSKQETILERPYQDNESHKKKYDAAHPNKILGILLLLIALYLIYLLMK